MRDLIDEVVALHERALAALDDHRSSDTVHLCRRALALLAACAGAHHADEANVATLLGTALDELGRHGEAEQEHRRALAAVAGVPHDQGVGRRLMARARLGLARCLRHQGRYEDAKALSVDVLAVADDDDLAEVHNEFGILCKFAGWLDEAEAAYGRALAALAPGDARQAQLSHNLAGLAHSRGDADRAESYARQALDLHRAAYPAEHPAVVADEAHLGAILLELRRYDEAEPLLRRAVEFFTQRYGPDHQEVLVNLHNLAALAAGRSRLDEAEELYQRVLAGKRRTLGPNHPQVGLTLNNLAVVVGDRGEPARATALAAEARAVLSGAVSDDHPALAAAIANEAHFAARAA